jgi:hypothetical protein
VLGGFGLLWPVAKFGEHVNEEGDRLILAFGGGKGI